MQELISLSKDKDPKDFKKFILKVKKLLNTAYKFNTKENPHSGVTFIFNLKGEVYPVVYSIYDKTNFGAIYVSDKYIITNQDISYTRLYHTDIYDNKTSNEDRDYYATPLEVDIRWLKEVLESYSSFKIYVDDNGLARYQFGETLNKKFGRNVKRTCLKKHETPLWFFDEEAHKLDGSIGNIVPKLSTEFLDDNNKFIIDKPEHLEIIKSLLATVGHTIINDSLDDNNKDYDPIYLFASSFYSNAKCIKYIYKNDILKDEVLTKVVMIQEEVSMTYFYSYYRYIDVWSDIHKQKNDILKSKS